MHPIRLEKTETFFHKQFIEEGLDLIRYFLRNLPWTFTNPTWSWLIHRCFSELELLHKGFSEFGLFHKGFSEFWRIHNELRPPALFHVVDQHLWWFPLSDTNPHSASMECHLLFLIHLQVSTWFIVVWRMINSPPSSLPLNLKPHQRSWPVKVS